MSQLARNAPTVVLALAQTVKVARSASSQNRHGVFNCARALT